MNEGNIIPIRFVESENKTRLLEMAAIFLFEVLNSDSAGAERIMRNFISLQIWSFKNRIRNWSQRIEFRMKTYSQETIYPGFQVVFLKTWGSGHLWSQMIFRYAFFWLNFVLRFPIDAGYELLAKIKLILRTDIENSIEI